MSELFTGLNDQQKAAVCHLQGPALVLAGAGSGKTRVLTTRIAHLIQEGVSPRRILALTFTNKAAREMSERVHSMCQQRVWVSTFHSLGFALLNEIVPSLFDYTPTLVDEEDSRKLIKRAADLVGGMKELFTPKDIRNTISLWKNQLFSPEQVLEDAKEREHRLLAETYQAYQKEKEKMRAVDFDDLIYLPVKLFKQYPDLQQKIQKRWDYLLVDEYQDTNASQFAFVQSLLTPPYNFFAVGDPDQTIYSWRGADLSNVLDFEKHFPQTTVYKLEQNYRSTPQVLEAANHLIENNSQRREKQLWTPRDNGPKISRIRAEDGFDEAELIAEEIAYLIEEEKICPSKIAIFYRTNAQSEPFESALTEQNIPFKIVGSTGFYQRKEIKDLLAFLRIIPFEKDILSLSRVLGLIDGGFGAKTVQSLREDFEKAALPISAYCQAALQGQRELRLRAKQRQALEQLYTLLQQLSASSSSLSKTIQALIHHPLFDTPLSKDSLTASSRREHLASFLDKAVRYEQAHQEATLKDFLNSLTLAPTDDWEQQNHKTVSLMSLHHGKGLEFPTVFLVGLEEGLLPHLNSLNDPTKLEEERRLLYVGITRSMHNLYLSHARYRSLWGRERTQTPSRFLREVPHHLTQTVEWVSQ